jgi:hypothetical protein
LDDPLSGGISLIKVIYFAKALQGWKILKASEDSVIFRNPEDVNKI